jgi:hypothetical protein
VPIVATTVLMGEATVPIVAATVPIVVQPVPIVATTVPIVDMLACCNPLGRGLRMTHWSMRGLAQVAAERCHSGVGP